MKMDLLLIGCTVDCLDVLMELFNAHKVTKDIFDSSVKLKIKFLQEMLEEMQPGDCKNKVTAILNRCDKILIDADAECFSDCNNQL